MSARLAKPFGAALARPSVDPTGPRRGRTAGPAPGLEPRGPFLAPLVIPKVLRVALGLALILAFGLAHRSLAADGGTGSQTGVPSSEGQLLARHLRTLVPQEPSTHRAVLRMRGPQGRRQVPVTVLTRPGRGGEADRWSVEYRACDPDSEEGCEVSTIHYRIDAAPTYQQERVPEVKGTPSSRPPAGSPGLEGPSPKASLGDRPIAGGDFLLQELGMEFLHWPEQRIRGRELSNGRWCRVLESRSGKTEGAVSVRSWIDEKLDVLLSAEVYDSRQQRLKQFSVTQFREQGDRWSCSVSMVDDRRGTKTELSFDGAAIPR